jgi:diacylglycerol kinase family enzyme
VTAVQNVDRPAISRRIAAFVAILCLVGALGVAVLLLRDDVARVAASLALIAAAVAGLWYVVSHRGVARVFGGLLAAGCLVALLVLIFTGEFHGLGLVAPVVLALGSPVFARFALHRDPRTLHATHEAGVRMPQPRRPVLLMNPKSGGGKTERFHLVDECRARGIEPIVLERGDDLVQLADDAIARGADAIGMAGGDGSQALVATAASRRGVPYVCVPAGTRNHFALDLGLDRADVVGALDAFQDGVERRVDLARVNGRVFVNNATLGLYAKIVQSEAYRAEKLKTAADMLPDLLGPGADPFDLRFAGPDGSAYPTAHLILVSNNPYQLDYLGGHGTRERLDSGELGVMAARIADTREAVELAALEAAGRVRDFRNWLEWEAPRFQVDSGGAVEIGVDGEALLMDPPLVFESLPGALRVRVPAHAPGFAPAAASVHLTTSTVGDLCRVIAGRPPAAANGPERARPSERA